MRNNGKLDILKRDFVKNPFRGKQIKLGLPEQIQAATKKD